MKKIILKINFVFIFLSLTSNVYSQNIDFEKKLDNTVQIDEYVNYRQNNIRYYKVLDDKILRVEKFKFQLYDKEFNKLWELEVDRLGKSSNPGKPSFMYVESDLENIFIAQISRTTNVTLPDELRLLKISKNGEISYKQTDILMTRFYDIDVTEDKLYVHLIKFDKAHLNSIDFSSKILIFNKELEYQSEIELPQTIENSKVVPKWIYNKFENNEFYYECYYYKKNGKVSIDKPNGAIMKKREIIVNEKGILFDSTSVMSKKLRFHQYSPNKFNYYPLMYDPNKFTIHIDDILLSNVRVFVEGKKVRINNGIVEKELYDIVKEFHPKLKRLYEITFVSFVPDPLNDNINLIVAATYPTRFLFTLNKNLEPVHAQIFKVFLDNMTEVKETTGNLSLGVSKSVESVGKYPEGHVMNALDYAVKLDGKPFITILNYSNYQLLFTDNKETGESKVYKFIK